MSFIMDIYTIIGAKKSDDIDKIKKLYRIKARELHPDKGGNINDFIKLKELFDTIMDPNKK